jgi:hypothetical protein
MSIDMTIQSAKKTVRVSSDADSIGFELEVHPFPEGGWIATVAGFRGIAAGTPTSVYLDGEAGFVQRRYDRLYIPPA